MVIRKAHGFYHIAGFHSVPNPSCGIMELTVILSLVLYVFTRTAVLREPFEEQLQWWALGVDHSASVKMNYVGCLGKSRI